MRSIGASLRQYHLHSGVPHMATQDDVYEGFFIPKGEYGFLNEHSKTHTHAHFSRRCDDIKYLVRLFCLCL